MIDGCDLPAMGKRDSAMKTPILLATCVAVALPFFASIAHAGGPIERACLRSDRKAASRSLCGCIQDVADDTLRAADQRRAASFFKDPEKAHKVWISKSKTDDEFWKRYKSFGAAAEQQCSG
jgi:hypothetical protein